jgi:hypothetical protein
MMIHTSWRAGIRDEYISTIYERCKTHRPQELVHPFHALKRPLLPLTEAKFDSLHDVFEDDIYDILRKDGLHRVTTRTTALKDLKLGHGRIEEGRAAGG